MSDKRNHLVGWNAVFSSKGYGIAVGRVVRFGQAPHFNTQQVRGRHTQTAYSLYRDPGDFMVVVRHSSYAAMDSFSKFFQGFGRFWDQRANSAQPMQVIIPDIQFSTLGMPNSSIPFGDTPQTVTWDHQIVFDAIALPFNKDYSTYHPAKTIELYDGSAEAAFHYPNSVQLSGSASEADAIYDGELDKKTLDQILAQQGGGAPTAPVHVF